MNFRRKESNAFSISIVAKYPANLLRSHLSIMLDINLLSFQMNLFLKYAVFCVKREHVLIFLRELLKLFWCQNLRKK